MNFNSFKKMAKGGLFLHRTRVADVVRRGTRADATWHARPHGSATRTHASACVALMWRGHVAGPRGRLSGATWQDGLQAGK